MILIHSQKSFHCLECARVAKEKKMTLKDMELEKPATFHPLFRIITTHGRRYM